MTIKFGGPEAVPAADVPAAVQRGTIDLGSIMSAYADALLPGCSTIGRAEFNPMHLRVNGAFAYYDEGFAKVGIKYLGASVASQPHEQTVLYLGKEISTLEDIKGLKIASTGGSNSAFIDSLGATTIPIDFVDYFTSMERGTVDGYNIGIPGVQDFSLTPVTKAMLDEPFSSCGGMMIMNLDKWNSLTEKQRAVLTQAMVNTEIDMSVQFAKTVEKVKADLEAAGVKIIHLSPEDSKAFFLKYREAMWAADMKRWPDVAPLLKELLVDPNFPRAN
jgi:TRAP-type C4-dicarboxylate transport system substrate-binding protein